MRGTFSLVIGGVIAVLAQIIIAPNIAVFSAMPNFILVYTLIMAILRPTDSVLVLAFALGLIYDLLGQGPVGAMAFLLVLASFVASRAFMVLNNDTAFMPIAIYVVAVLFVELAYAALLLAFGAQFGILEAFIYRALPCALYDCVVGLIFYPLAMRFLVSAPKMGSAHATPSGMGAASATLTTMPRKSAHRKQNRH